MSSAKSRRVIMVPIQSKMARAGTGMSMIAVAKAAQVSPATIVRFERGEELKPRTVEAVQQAYERAGIEFTNGDAPGVKLHPGRAKKKSA
jgi:transcriptional regulator with XRE-family HTH domain